MEEDTPAGRLIKEIHARGLFFDKVSMSCAHCLRQLDEHVDLKCLFDHTRYEPLGADRTKELIRRHQDELLLEQAMRRNRRESFNQRSTRFETIIHRLTKP